MKYTGITDVDSIKVKVLKKTPLVDYTKESNKKLFKTAEGIDDPELKAVIISKAEKPDVETIAIHSASIMRGLFEELGYGICSVNGAFYIYNGVFWDSFSDLQMKHFITEFLKKTGVPKSKAENVIVVERLFKQFDYSLNVFVPKPAEKAAKLNAMNCTILIQPDGKILTKAHEKEDFFFNGLPYAYDLSGKAPRFKQFLDEVIPGDIQLVVQEFFGTCLVPSIKHEKVLVCVGSGANGKSVLFETVSHVLGKSNVTSFNINTLCDEKSTTRILIKNKLLNYSSDFSGKIWGNGIFKQLASGEPVEARRLYNDSEIIDQYAKLAYNSNTMPDSSDTSEGFRRRLLIVEFRKVITKPDPLLAQKLKKEAPGILNWMIDGLIRFIQNGYKFSKSEMLEETSKAFREESDSVSIFIKARGYKPDKKSNARVADVYAEYKEFCDEKGMKNILSQIDFRMRLGGMGFEISQSKKKPWMIGIGKETEKHEKPGNSPFDSPFQSYTSPSFGSAWTPPNEDNAEGDEGGDED